MKKFPVEKFVKFLIINPGSGTGSGSPIRTKCWIRIRIKSMQIRNPAFVTENSNLIKKDLNQVPVNKVY